MDVRSFLRTEFRTQVSKAISGVLVLLWVAILGYGVPALSAATGLTWWGALGWAILGLLLFSAVVGWLIYRESTREPTRSEWLEMEARFALIDGEVEAHWHVYVAEPDCVEWSVYPQRERTAQPVGSGARRLERFRAEAHRAGQMIQRVPDLTTGYKVSRNADPEDHWLSALGATIHTASGMRGSGRDKRGEYVSRFMERVVEASKTMCARLAARAKE